MRLHFIVLIEQLALLHDGRLAFVRRALDP